MLVGPRLSTLAVLLDLAPAAPVEAAQTLVADINTAVTSATLSSGPREFVSTSNGAYLAARTTGGGEEL